MRKKKTLDAQYSTGTSEIGLALHARVRTIVDRRVTLPFLRRVVSLRKSLMLRVNTVVNDKIRHNTSSKIVPSPDGLIVHLGWRNRHRKMVLLQ
jgi:hypothetical protein